MATASLVQAPEVECASNRAYNTNLVALKNYAPSICQLMKRFFALLATLCALPVHASEPVSPIKVFVLAGQSNMEGQAVVDLKGKDYNDGKGTLKVLMSDPAKAPLFRHLRNDDGTWAVRDDVWVRYKRENGPLLKGPLAIGFSVYADKHHFGPELQFGHVLGDYFDSQVLLIKTAWGGKSLFKDFRPPSSGGTVGPYYAKMVAEIREALAAMPNELPEATGAYELAGFVWYQGWNDGVDPQHAVPEYEQNLVNLIRDIRREFSAPKLPFVIGELTGAWVEAPGACARLREPSEMRPSGLSSSKMCSSSKRMTSCASHRILRIQATGIMSLEMPKPTSWSAMPLAKE